MGRLTRHRPSNEISDSMGYVIRGSIGDLMRNKKGDPMVYPAGHAMGEPIGEPWGIQWGGGRSGSSGRSDGWFHLMDKWLKATVSNEGSTVKAGRIFDYGGHSRIIPKLWGALVESSRIMGFWRKTGEKQQPLPPHTFCYGLNMFFLLHPGHSFFSLATMSSSWVWDYFIKDPGNKMVVTCKVCKEKNIETKLANSEILVGGCPACA